MSGHPGIPYRYLRKFAIDRNVIFLYQIRIFQDLLFNIRSSYKKRDRQASPQLSRPRE